MNGIGGMSGASSVQDLMALRSRILEQQQFVKALDRGAVAPQAPAQGEAKTDFASALHQSLEAVNASQEDASRLSSAYERGETTDVASVMMARAEAGVAFEGALQTRNKLLNAYQEIMRMGL